MRRIRARKRRKPYPASPSGMTGVQTLVPIMLDHVNAGRLSLLRFVDLTSAGPARLFGIAAKGRIAVGYDADLTVVDLKRRETITDRWVASRAGWTPYDGVTVTGWPVGTLVRGHKVMWEGALTAPAAGRARALPGDPGQPGLTALRAPICFILRGFRRGQVFPSFLHVVAMWNCNDRAGRYQTVSEHPSFGGFGP